jgi:hypothetical protein
VADLRISLYFDVIPAIVNVTLKKRGMPRRKGGRKAFKKKKNMKRSWGRKAFTVPRALSTRHHVLL